MVASRFPVDPSLQAPLTVEKYHRMIDAGVFEEDDRIELLEGVLVEMSPQGDQHANFISRLTTIIARLLEPGYRVRVQLPLTLPPYGEPEPDFAIVTEEEDDVRGRHPQMALLVVEVASESLRKDRSIKSRVYARAGITEYWIADVDKQRIEIYRDPDPSAEQYRSHSIAEKGDELIPHAFPAVRLAVNALFRL